MPLGVAKITHSYSDSDSMHILANFIFRPLVDSEADLGDTSGLYTHCVTISMGEGEGKVVEQSIMPGKLDLYEYFN